MIAPTWESLAKKVQGQVNVGKVDCTESQYLSNMFDVRGFPTLKLISKGRVYGFSGRRSLENLEPWALQGSSERAGARSPAGWDVAQRDLSFVGRPAEMALASGRQSRAAESEGSEAHEEALFRILPTGDMGYIVHEMPHRLEAAPVSAHRRLRLPGSVELIYRVKGPRDRSACSVVQGLSCVEASTENNKKELEFKEDGQDEKGDIITKYTAEEARSLKNYGELPENVKINETDIGDGDDSEDGVEFDEAAG
ncbi:unnamed protein product [Symbiodinium necroappetens]|uniref:Thioredoxin domain-containing protein n=1 Tax=Symbiodinium necroappetens TaxID=1628268 RepID=A0A812PS86_9DINO|nr:unnamed protein product [Symbiodinium necroappetens]